jgi:hypothetical protein
MILLDIGYLFILQNVIEIRHFIFESKITCHNLVL